MPHCKLYVGLFFLISHFGGGGMLLCTSLLATGGCKVPSPWKAMSNNWRSKSVERLLRAHCTITLRIPFSFRVYDNLIALQPWSPCPLLLVASRFTDAGSRLFPSVCSANISTSCCFWSWHCALCPWAHPAFMYVLSQPALCFPSLWWKRSIAAQGPWGGNWERSTMQHLLGSPLFLKLIPLLNENVSGIASFLKCTPSYQDAQLMEGPNVSAWEAMYTNTNGALPQAFPPGLNFSFFFKYLW